MTRAQVTFDTHTPQETLQWGCLLGKHLYPGVVICLFGDLGSGKTVFIQGMAKGLEVPETMAVTSPTYGLIHNYIGRLPLYHADLYRLPADIDPDDFELGDLLYGDGVVAIEWAQRLAKNCLDGIVEVHFHISGDTTRHIRVRACGQTESDLVEVLRNYL